MFNQLLQSVIARISAPRTQKTGRRRLAQQPVSCFVDVLEDRVVMTVSPLKVSQDNPVAQQYVSDVSLTLPGGSGNITPGELADFSMRLQNNGPNPAPVVATMAIPQGFILETSISAGWIQQNATTVTYTANMGNGESRVIAAAFEVGNLTGTQHVTASVSTTNVDTNLTNNNLSWTTTITQPMYSDVSLGLAGGTTSVPSTELLDLIMTARNSGPNNAPIMVTMTIPRGFRLETSISDGWIQKNATTVTYTSNLKKGESRILAAAFAVDATISGKNTVTARITTTNVDTNMKNNLVSWITNVTQARKTSKR